MIGTVAERRQAKVTSIVAEAWALAREHGLGGLSLRALAQRVGVRQPSLYEYFDSKHALYDAMFADGNRQLLARLDKIILPKDPRRALKEFTHAFADFVLEDDVRAQLLFQRVIPSFQPLPDSYQYAERVLGRHVELLRAAGMDDPGDIDCFVAMVAGILDAQAANDPGGMRWLGHLDRLIDLHLDNAKGKRLR